MMVWLVLLFILVICYLLEKILRSFKVGNFTDKFVFITGCDSGFGRNLAVRLDSLGFHVFACCITEDGSKSLSEECSSRLTTVHLDVRETESIRAALKTVMDKLPPNKGLWALVNNAGIVGLFNPNEMLTRQDYQDVLEVNLLGMADLTNHLLPLIRKAKGRIVNTASVCGRLGFIASPYTMSKFAVEGYSDILRQEVANQGIRVSIVEPGAFMTPIFDRISRESRKAFDRASKEAQEVYGFDRVTQALGKLTSSANHNISPVVDAYTHAVTSRYPRTRYAVGADAHFFYLPVSYLPAPISDFIISKA